MYRDHCKYCLGFTFIGITREGGQTAERDGRRILQVAAREEYLHSLFIPPQWMFPSLLLSLVTAFLEGLCCFQGNYFSFSISMILQKHTGAAKKSPTFVKAYKPRMNVSVMYIGFYDIHRYRVYIWAHKNLFRRSKNDSQVLCWLYFVFCIQCLEQK